jgi:hypothetical protein
MGVDLDEERTSVLDYLGASAKVEYWPTDSEGDVGSDYAERCADGGPSYESTVEG